MSASPVTKVKGHNESLCPTINTIVTVLQWAVTGYYHWIMNDQVFRTIVVLWPHLHLLSALQRTLCRVEWRNVKGRREGWGQRKTDEAMIEALLLMY